ncbi:MAG: MFS transporter [Bryobacterales bacterium]|nr:MFS transporter [Bryobacterales bacterium]
MNAARILLHGLFILVGVITTMLGPLLPFLMRRWSLSDGEAGALFTAQFLTAVATSVLMMYFMRRFRAWRLMVTGYLLCGIGVLGLAAPHWQWGFLGVCVWGLGLGMINPAANLAAATLMPDRPATGINLLNFFFSIGATLAPPVIAGFVDFGLGALFPILVAALTLLGAAAAGRYFVPDFQGSFAGVASHAHKFSRRLPFLVLCMILLFVYVGVETSSGGWASTYLQRIAGADAVLAASASAAFWGAILVSRLSAVWVLRYARVLTVLTGSILLVITGGVLMLLLPSPLAVIASIAIIGLGCGPIFANTLAYFLEHYGNGADRLSGLMFAAGGTGGALIPLLIGEVSDAAGSLRLGLTLIPACALAMLLLLAAVAYSRPGRGNRPDATGARETL